MSKPIHIAHIGMYRKNVGDTLALLGARKIVAECAPRPVRFTEVDMYPLCFKGGWNIYDHMRAINDSCDAILFGGGGLIESRMYRNSPTGWKMPINRRIASLLSVPILCLGLGLNTWRPFEEFSAEARRGIEILLARARLVTLRKDGTKNKLREILGYDPQCIEGPSMAYVAVENLPAPEPAQQVLYQPSVNKNRILMKGRWPNGVREFEKLLPPETKVLPHTLKDFGCAWPLRYLMTPRQLTDGLEMGQVLQWVQQWYRGRTVIALRGHGVLLAVLRGIPSVFVSTMDKVRDYCRLQGFSEWCVDTEDPHFKDKFVSLLAQMLDDGSDCRRRWKRAQQRLIEQRAEQFLALKEAVRNAVCDL